MIKLTYPPKLEEIDLLPWVDSLVEIVPTKITELLSEMREITEEYDDSRAMLTQAYARGEVDEESLKFTSLYIGHRFARYEVRKRFLNYWLDLYDKIPVEKPAVDRTRPVYEENNLEQIKQIPIERFYEGPLRKSADRLCGKCPFHEEKTGSFFIFDDNHFHCFSCGEHGDVITFIMKTKNLDFKEAIKFLK